MNTPVCYIHGNLPKADGIEVIDIQIKCINCDMAVLYASALEAVGIPTRLGWF